MSKIFAIILAALMALSGVAFAEETLIGMPNPWISVSAEELTDTLGLAFSVPEGAENIAYRILEAEQMAEMTFSLDGMDYTARIKPAAEFEDISGMYFDWETPNEDSTVAGIPAWEARANDGDTTLDLCMWFDAAPGLMYSLSTGADDLDGFDIIAIAEQVYLPMQGDA